MASAVVPAAGAATRFGGGKLLAPIEGVPMLDRTIGALLDAGIADVVVVRPPGDGWDAQFRSLRDARVRTVLNPDPSRGMFSSIQIGVGAVSGAPIAVLPGDMPFVRSETVRALMNLAGRADAIVSPVLNGRRGHPVFLPADLAGVILAAPPYAALSELLRPLADRFVNLVVTDPGVVRDVDVVEDLT
jgi:molybdenum cofactor cytidylyltransferase